MRIIKTMNSSAAVKPVETIYSGACECSFKTFIAGRLIEGGH